MINRDMFPESVREELAFLMAVADLSEAEVLKFTMESGHAEAHSGCNQIRKRHALLATQKLKPGRKRAVGRNSFSVRCCQASCGFLGFSLGQMSWPDLGPRAGLYESWCSVCVCVFMKHAMCESGPGLVPTSPLTPGGFETPSKTNKSRPRVFFLGWVSQPKLCMGARCCMSRGLELGADLVAA